MADSITKVRKHHVFRSGEGLAKKLLISNFVAGCTMLLRAESAKEAVPFCPDMVHDHYLALYAARSGVIVSLKEKLIRYRIHENNQTMMMAGVTDKASYLRIRIESLIRRMRWLKERFCDDLVLSREIETALIWAEARRANFLGDRNAGRTVMRYRRFNPLISLFETALSGAPENVFMLFITLKRKNLL